MSLTILVSRFSLSCVNRNINVIYAIIKTRGFGDSGCWGITVIGIAVLIGITVHVIGITTLIGIMILIGYHCDNTDSGLIPRVWDRG